MVHDCDETGVPEIVHEVSLKENPEPVIVIVVPGLPLVGERTIDAEVTVKMAWAESPPGLPVTVTRYGPGTTFATMKVPLTTPLPGIMKQAWVDTTEPETEQDVSLGKKPVPVTFTLDPTELIAGTSLIVGPEVTWKLVSAKSPLLPVSRTT
jgi:hypothetical protein